MPEVRSYVVRVYRQDNPECAGVVEAVATGEVRPFHSAAELWALVNPSAHPRRRQPKNNPKESQE